jgi:hypothetical protein
VLDFQQAECDPLPLSLFQVSRTECYESSNFTSSFPVARTQRVGECIDRANISHFSIYSFTSILLTELIIALDPKCALNWQDEAVEK